MTAFRTPFGQAVYEFNMLIRSKHHASPELFYAWQKIHKELEGWAWAYAPQTKEAPTPSDAGASGTNRDE